MTDKTKGGLIGPLEPKINVVDQICVILHAKTIKGNFLFPTGPIRSKPHDTRWLIILFVRITLELPLTSQPLSLLVL